MYLDTVSSIGQIHFAHHCQNVRKFDQVTEKSPDAPLTWQMWLCRHGQKWTCDNPQNQVPKSWRSCPRCPWRGVSSLKKYRYGWWVWNFAVLQTCDFQNFKLLISILTKKRANWMITWRNIHSNGGKLVTVEWQEKLEGVYEEDLDGRVQKRDSYEATVLTETNAEGVFFKF